MAAEMAPPLSKRARLANALRANQRRVLAPAIFAILVGLITAWNLILYTPVTPQLLVKGAALPVAKVFAGVATVCYGFMFLPVSRNLMTLLRSTWLRHAIDFDGAYSFHAWLGGLGALAGIAHGVAEIFTKVYAVAATPAQRAAAGIPPHLTAYESFTTRQMITGWVMLFLIVVCYAWALPWPRRAAWLRGTSVGKVLNNFTGFWISHHVLIFGFTVVLIIHSVHPEVWRLAKELSTNDFFWHHVNKLLIFFFPFFIIYLGERVLRVLRASRYTPLRRARLLPGDVLELRLGKPRGFRYIPGQYLYLCCPQVSQFEWHPFTMTSAPQDPFISVHIKKAGDWTAALHALVQQLQLSAPGAQITTAPTFAVSSARHKGGGGSSGSGVTQASSLRAWPSALLQIAAGAYDPTLSALHEAGGGGGDGAGAPLVACASGAGPKEQQRQGAGPPGAPGAAAAGVAGAAGVSGDVEAGAAEPAGGELKVFVDGPFGAPTQDFHDYEVVCLIGAGIGITPMASVLRSLLHALYDSRCARCGEVNQKLCPIHQTKVYFHWVLPDTTGVQWFEAVLHGIKKHDTRGMFDIHVHLTRAKKAPAPAPAPQPDAPAPAAAGAGSPFAAAAAGGAGGAAGGGGGDAGGLQYHTGRPDFGAIMASLSAAHAGAADAVGVFYCGNKVLGSNIKGACDGLNARRRQEAALERGALLLFHEEVF